VSRSPLLIALAALALLAGCAKPGPPPGGPLDEDPPWVVSTEPADGAVDVPVDAGIFVLFSEEMNRSSVERAIEITPEITQRRARWRGPRLEIRTVDELSDSTTYVVTLGEGIRDYHSVPMDAVTTFAFSTGGAIDDCAVMGSVTSNGEPAVGATVWICAASPQPDSLGVIDRCGASTMTESGGAYAIGYLNPARSPYSLIAFLDSNSDGAYAPLEEPGIIARDLAVFASAGDTLRGVDLALEPPSGVPASGEPSPDGTTMPRPASSPILDPLPTEPEEQK